MAKVLVKNRRLHYNGKNYFRGSSEDVVLGSYGEKRKYVFSANFLETEGQVDLSKVPQVEATVADIDTRRTREGSINQTINGSLKGVDVTVSADQAWKKLREGDLKLVKLHVDFNDLEDAANADRDALEDLKDMGANARIVSDVWVVMSASLAETFDRAQSIDVTGGKGPIEISVKGRTGQTGRERVTISEGTTFAYLLASIDWDRRRRRLRKRIVDLDTDQWGLA